MRFWDSSAVVPLLVSERMSTAVMELYRADAELLTWWSTQVECVSAIARLERDGALTPIQVQESLRRLDALVEAWSEIEPGQQVREGARRFLRVHELRAADAFQLSAAFVASEGRPATLEIVSLDDRLCAAAAREGFGMVDCAALG